jgi:hypothetical protein
MTSDDSFLCVTNTWTGVEGLEVTNMYLVGLPAVLATALVWVRDDAAELEAPPITMVPLPADIPRLPADDIWDFTITTRSEITPWMSHTILTRSWRNSTSRRRLSCALRSGSSYGTVKSRPKVSEFLTVIVNVIRRLACHFQYRNHNFLQLKWYF